MTAPIVIVGSGLAGYGLARELRKLDPSAAITVITRDEGGAYSKPMLSNALAGGKTAASLVTKTAETLARELGVEIRTRTAISAIDTAAQQVVLDDGARIAYRDLVLALGADPIRVPLEGSAADRMLSVNDVADFAAYAQALDVAPDPRVLILGAGLIGCEFANDLLARGFEPTLVDPADRALSRLMPQAASLRFERALETAGVRFRFGTSVKRVDLADDGRTIVATLANGEVIEAGVVLSAIGLRPRVDLARHAGIGVNRGVVVDPTLATSAPGVWAVGDCAEVHGQVLPYVMPLMQQTRALAATLSGRRTAVSYPVMPVIVKTPACPTVVAPPPADAIGEWRCSDDPQGGLEAEFLAPDGALKGFVLIGAATTKRQAFAARVS